ncbi:MAG TPA: LamG domain-containing protein, partial [Polyangiaceae bacterium]
GVTLGLKGAIANDPNTAMALDGTSGAMYLPGTIFDFGGSPAFAIEVWVSPGAPPPADASDPFRRIVSHRTTSPYFGWFMQIDATQHIVFQRWDSNAPVSTVTSPPLPQNQFTHVVASADGSNITLYLNGAEVANGPEGTITDTPATHVSFGATSDFTVEWFDGSLDEPAIYTHALAAARVLAHYQAGIGN